MFRSYSIGCSRKKNSCFLLEVFSSQLFQVILFFLFPLSLFAFEVEPWFTPLAEINLRSSYSYRYYPNINHAYNPSHYSSHDQLIDFNLGISFYPNWDFQAETDFSNTRKLSWGTQRVGMQVRYLLMDDIGGAPVSLSVGGKIFYVPTRNMRDPSSPYHAQGNLEVGGSVGKEITNIYDWKYRFYGFFGLGIGNRGYPWCCPLLSTQFKYKHKHKFELFTQGYFGFGNKYRVNFQRLNGYAKIMHQSIDIGGSYYYLLGIWGSLAIHYAYRLYARSFPEYANIITVKYILPFSIF